jgi:hypothetical protein
MNAKLLLPTLLFSTFLFSCHNNAKETQAMDSVMADIKQNAPPQKQKSGQNEKIPVGNANQNSADSAVVQTPAIVAAHTDWDKKIIKTAIVQLEVKDFKKYNETIHNSIRQFGGYIAQEEQNLTDEKSETVLTLKVPVDQFEIVMNALPAGDVKVIQRKITSEDVTGEVIDTRSRLEAKKQVRLKYLDFLKASKNMEEVLQVQGEINSIQEEIEAAAGRVEYLSHQSAYSTINLTFDQPAVGFKPTDVSPTFLTRLGNAFKSGADWLTELLVALISIWPIWLIVIGGIIGYKRMRSLKVMPQKL